MKKIKIYIFSLFVASFITGSTVIKWGFFAHELINQHAVYTLPKELNQFYNNNMNKLIAYATLPDKRRYAVDYEGPRHFLDMDELPDSLIRYSIQPKDTSLLDTLEKTGILPWYLQNIYYQLRNAFMQKDKTKIIRLSAELGHYLADAHVPLHTTSNYNGQKTNQKGIHGLWESRLPELFHKKYVLITGRATYVENTQEYFWDIIEKSNTYTQKVLDLEKLISEKHYTTKYSYEQRGRTQIRVYSQEFCSEYHDALDGMVEKQLKSSIKAIGDIWYTCWVNAGQPVLE